MDIYHKCVIENSVIRLGLCCKFIDVPIKFRSTTATYLAKTQDPLAHVNEIVGHNIEALKASILYCKKHGIGCFRIGSDFMPAATHPEVGYTLSDLPDGEQYIKALTALRQKEIRLTFHPDQFVVLNSPKPDVVEKSIRDIEYHTALADLVGADVINIHGGGGYGNKPSALARFRENFQKLSTRAKELLTVENDDRVYTPNDLLPLCHDLGIPLVYDVHHHRFNPDTLSVEEATEKTLSTWNREPLFHISSPKNKTRSHHDYINPKDFPTCWKTIDPLTIEVEAKAKEKAVLKLLKDLK